MTGHIRQRGKASWELKFDIPPDPLNGKRRVRYASYKGSKRDAEKELARLVSAVVADEYIDPSKLTLSQFLDRWQRDWAEANTDAKTLERYLELLRLHVRPRLGDVRIQKLKAGNLQELYATLLREGRGDRGLAPRTVGHVHRVVHRALGHAADWSIVQRNVAEQVKPPRVEKTEIFTLTVGEVRAILRKLRGGTLYPIAALALATGMRRGELLALRWKDVDLDGCSLRVERSLSYTKRAGLRFKSPKTKYSRRTISLPRSSVDELRAHWKAQQERRLKLGLGKAREDGLVFPRIWDEEPRNPVGVTKEWSVAMDVAGMPDVTLHSLRHTHASHLIAAGLDVLTISRRLGHSSPTVTLGVYGHLFSNSDDRAAQVMDAALNGA